MLDHLFTPLALGPAVLPCRIVSTAHQTTLVHDHLPPEDFVAYQHARAQGGVGLIVMEAVAVAPSGLLTAHTIGGYLDGTADAYRRVAAAVQGEGSKLFVQLFHGGREVIASAPRPVISSASALPSHRFHTEPRAFRTAEVEDVVAGYARCAAIAAEAGLDGIEITAAHNYLLEQFFSAATNQRDDRYGEPARLVVDVLEAVRDAAPRLALGVRLSADSEAAQAVAPRLAPLVDFIHLAVGDSATFDGLIASGAADAFGMNRALITDPEMPRKAREGAAILRCIGCNACIAHLVAALDPDLVVVATGARPAAPRHPLDGVPVHQVWDVLAGVRPAGRILIADWGGGSSALDCAGVRIEHYLGLESAAGESVRFRNIFAPDLETVIETDALLVALGRVPDDGLAVALRDRGGLLVEEAGDCRSPRSIEEAVLEGTIAARGAVPARVAA